MVKIMVGVCGCTWVWAWGATELGPGRLRPAFVTELGPGRLRPGLKIPTLAQADLGPVLKIPT